MGADGRFSNAPDVQVQPVTFVVTLGVRIVLVSGNDRRLLCCCSRASSGSSTCSWITEIYLRLCFLKILRFSCLLYSSLMIRTNDVPIYWHPSQSRMLQSTASAASIALRNSSFVRYLKSFRVCCHGLSFGRLEAHKSAWTRRCLL